MAAADWGAAAGKPCPSAGFASAVPNRARQSRSMANRGLIVTINSLESEEFIVIPNH